ncbi:MAG: hypothetical protein NT157_03845 [Candidatus Micrarchaeota archaeon]|nr:hypothetical protein [Candidatus Micrarchaeota archaeon]
MKSPAGFLVQIVGAVLLVAAVAGTGPVIAKMINANEAIGGLLAWIFLCLAAVICFGLGLVMHKIEALVGE